jgi:hypothetical protein
MRDFSVKVEPRDAWVGLYWDRRRDGLHVYVCPVPFVVLHAVFGRPRPAHPAIDEALRRLSDYQRRRRS